MEILISDDGSSDGSIDICREYVKKDSRVQVFERGEPHGSCGDINFSLSHATGEFACKMDSDDLMGEHYWENVLPYFNKPTVGIVSIGLMIMDSTGTSLLRNEFPMRLSGPVEIFHANRFYSGCPFRMEMYRQVGGWDIGHLHPDWDFWIRCLFNKWEWTYCMKQVYYYRKHQKSILFASNDEKREVARAYYRQKYVKEMDTWGLQPAPPGSQAIGLPKCGKIDA